MSEDNVKSSSQHESEKCSNITGVVDRNYLPIHELYQVPTAFSTGGWASTTQGETQVGQRHEDVDRKWQYYHIIFVKWI
jgi:hypothetical protein